MATNLLRRSEPTWSATKLNDENDVIAALRPVAAAFEKLRIDFYVGGSVASSFHGAMRSTFDVDIVADLALRHVLPFIESIGDTHYVSESAMRAAVQRRTAFNLIHLATSFKVDVFARRTREYDVAAAQRAQPGQLDSTDGFTVRIASPEDSILSKLEWYRLGGEVSERQWNDVTTLWKLLGESMDVDYLSDSAVGLGVSDLLMRLMR